MTAKKILSKVLSGMLIILCNCSILNDVQEDGRGCNYNSTLLAGCYPYLEKTFEEQAGSELVCFQQIYYREKCKKKLKNNLIHKL